MGLYKGISKKKMSDGSTSIMVRFKHQGITYPVKNFTKIYGCKTEKEAFDKLGEVKGILSKGKNPFASSKNTLSEIFDEKRKLYEENKTWGVHTVRNYGYFFNKHIRPHIGKLKIEKIKYEHIKNILDNFEKDQHGNKNKVLDILKPIFREEFNKGNILENIMDKFVKKRFASQKEPMSIRSKTKPDEIVKRLYKAIPFYGREQAWVRNIEEHKVFLYMVVLTAHRIGEIAELRKEHCHLEDRMIIAPKEITKTNEDYHFPIPDECYEYIENHKGGKLFNITARGGTISRLFRRLVNIADIDTISHYNITAHDSRKLMISIMTGHLGIDSRLADYCLDHKQQGVIKHYLEFTYEDKAKAYKKYWNFIREVATDEIIEKPQKEQASSNKGSNFDKLIELRNMLNDGLLTKELFEYERDKLYE